MSGSIIGASAAIELNVEVNSLLAKTNFICPFEIALRGHHPEESIPFSNREPCGPLDLEYTLGCQTLRRCLPTPVPRRSLQTCCLTEQP